MTQLASDSLREQFAINLRERRDELGMSQRELAFRADLHKTTIYGYERAARLPFIDGFIRLAGALEVPANSLTAGIRWVPPEPITIPGQFDVPPDPSFEAAVAALREQLGRDG